jgi:probable addiction module antidote protein
MRVLIRAKARGVSQFASETGLSRETIYKVFRPGKNPTIEMVNKALKALGLSCRPRISGTSL